MTLKLHNTLTKKNEELSPLTPGTIGVYSCGPTVYDAVHIGNLSAFIAADTLRRALNADGLNVTHVMNFTDVDDKTIQRSHEIYPNLEPMEALKKLTDRYGKAFIEDMQRVGNDTEAMTFIKATDKASIEAMQSLISELFTQGFAYIADDGVYFSIDAYRKSGKKYGQLTEITEDSTGNERIQNDEYDKESTHDFALWKKQKPGEPAWEFSLDGQDLSGRPGWHIECSAMSKMVLGQPFDIHTGGIDLVFPHHENEIAQSTAGMDNPVYATMFVHNEHILVDNKKMAKSANNFYTLNDIIEKGIDPLAFRLLVLQSHYRKPTNFSFENVDAATSRLRHWRSVAALRWQTSAKNETVSDELIRSAALDIAYAINDDINTPKVLQIIDDLFTKIENMTLNEISKPGLTTFIHHIDNLLALGLIKATPELSEDVKHLLKLREEARQNKDYGESDRLRDLLLEKGLAVKDTQGGSVWSYS